MVDFTKQGNDVIENLDYLSAPYSNKIVYGAPKKSGILPEESIGVDVPKAPKVEAEIKTGHVPEPKAPIDSEIGHNVSEGGRNSAGVVIGGENLPVAKRIIHGNQGNAGVVPKEIADKMRGKQFSSFDSFRKDFWMTSRLFYK